MTENLLPKKTKKKRHRKSPRKIETKKTPLLPPPPPPPHTPPPHKNMQQNHPEDGNDKANPHTHMNRFWERDVLVIDQQNAKTKSLEMRLYNQEHATFRQRGVRKACEVLRECPQAVTIPLEPNLYVLYMGNRYVEKQYFNAK